MHLRVVAVAVASLFAGCFDPDDEHFVDTDPGTTTGDGVPDGGSDPSVDDGVSSAPPPGSEGGSEGGDGCSVDGDCVDVDTCSVDACEDGVCVHTPNLDDPACACATPADCVQLPDDTECRTRTCVDSVCGLDFAPSGTPLNETRQTAEDCHLVVCDGAGEPESVVDDADVPVDGLECTTDVCDDGVPQNVPVDAGTECAAGECDDDGDCVGCSEPADCGGTSTFCQVVTCEDQVCGVALTDAGTVLDEQESGDCQVLQCDGRGNAASVADDTDLPGDDGNQCTADACDDGVEVHPAEPVNSGCTQGGGTVCDGMGTCVECNSSSQCGGGGGCLVPACDDNECTLVGNTGAACDDGLFCTQIDTCNSGGTCVGSGDPCDGADGDSDCSEGCNETANNCSGADPSGSPCDDGLFCTETDTCNGSGSCNGSGNPCNGPDGDADCSETCNESANACSANDPNGTDCGGCSTCSNGACNFNCGPLSQCCSGDDICISMGQECP
jgi:hypothetical protein